MVCKQGVGDVSWRTTGNQQNAEIGAADSKAALDQLLRIQKQLFVHLKFDLEV